MLHWLTVDARINYKMLVLVVKSLYGHVPQYVAGLLRVKVNSRTLKSSHQNLLCIPFIRIKSYGEFYRTNTTMLVKDSYQAANI
jgi:hypothetical protein